MAFWDQIRSLLGLEEPRAAQTVATTIQALLIALATLLVARWASERIQLAAKGRGATADIASIAARTAAFIVFVFGIAVILSVVGLNPTAIAAILGAATFGISLALQDVAKAFVNGVYVLLERPILAIEHAVTQALRGAPHLSRRQPYVEVTSTGPKGTTAYVTVEHDLGHRVDGEILSRLRAEFSEATVSSRLLDGQS